MLIAMSHRITRFMDGCLLTAVQVQKTDVETVWCEVKPLHFKSFPGDIAQKIKSAEPQEDNDLIVAILGLEAPVWLDNLPALGWISLRRRSFDHLWHPFRVGNSGTEMWFKCTSSHLCQCVSSVFLSDHLLSIRLTNANISPWLLFANNEKYF